MAIIDDRDLFNDVDLLDFEDPANREEARRRMMAYRPATVSAARYLMFLQAASPLFIPIIAIATGGGGGDESAPTTTTTTVAGAAGQARRGGGGGFFIFFLLFLGLIVGLIFAGGRLARLTTAARTMAIALEGVLLLGAGALAARGNIFGMVLAASALAVIALLLAPATKHGISQATAGDTSARFDIRSLQGLDQ
jgi:hypothetical protein